MQKIQELLHASIVQKVVKELENHIGISNETLAEFIIDLKKRSKDIKEFEKQLNDNQAEFDITLIQSLWRMIEAMAPKQITSSSNTKPNSDQNKASTPTKSSIWKSYVNPCTMFDIEASQIVLKRYTVSKDH